MKSTSLIMIACMLLEMLSPCISVLAQMGPGKEEERVGRSDTETRSGRKMVSGNDRSLKVAERAIRLFYQVDVVVMSRSTLDPSKLEDDWYAYVFYNYETDKRAELAEIAEIGERHLAIYSSYGSWGSSGSLKEIPYDDIHIIVGAENRGDIESWRNARQVIKRLISDPELRFKAPAIMDKLSEGRWTPGRLFDVIQDTFMIAVGPSRLDVYPVPASAVTGLEFYSGRRRNTGKGLLVGLAAGTAAALAISANVEQPQWNTADTGYEVSRLVPGFLVPVIVFTTIGALIQTDRWVDAPMNRLNLSVAPTTNIGFGAAVTFNF